MPKNLIQYFTEPPKGGDAADRLSGQQYVQSVPDSDIVCRSGNVLDIMRADVVSRELVWLKKG